MAEFRSAEIEHALGNKLGGVRSESKHIVYHVYDSDDRLIARTQLSRRPHVDDSLMSQMAKQLNISRRFWIELYRCDHDRDDYLKEASER